MPGLGDDQCLSGFETYATTQAFSAPRDHTYLSGWACGEEQHFSTLRAAEAACNAQGDCCGGITYETTDANTAGSKGDYTLRQGQTPLPSPATEANAFAMARSHIKEVSRGRAPEDGMEGALHTIQSDSVLSRACFSDANQVILQNGLRRRVFDLTGEVVSTQDHLQLQIIMRSVFLQNAKHQPANIAGQIAVLNEHVLDESVPRVTTQLLQYRAYLKDASELPTPMEHAISVTQKGTRSLQPNPFV